MLYLNLGIIVCIMFIFIGWYSEKKVIVNPVTVFCGVWAIVLLLSSLQYYTMYLASEKTYGIILVGIISYIVGYYFNKIITYNITIRLGKFNSKSKNSRYRIMPKYKFLTVLCVLAIVYNLYSLVNVVGQINTFNLGEIQQFLQSGEYQAHNNSILNAIAVLIISPITLAMPVIVAVDFWYGERNKKLAILTIILLVLRMMSTANRSTIMIFCTYIVVSTYIFMYHNKKGNIKIKKIISLRSMKKYIYGISIIAVIAFVLMTISRGSSIVRNLYINFSMPPMMFEIWAQKVNEGDTYGYGAASLMGFIYPFAYVIKNALGMPIAPVIQNAYDWTMSTDTLWVYPGQRIRANAYVSIFWFLYLDARILGVVLGMFIFGIVVSKGFDNVVKKQHSSKHVAIYCLLFYAVFISYARFQFTIYAYGLAFLFVLFFAYKKVPLVYDNEYKEM